MSILEDHFKKEAQLPTTSSLCQLKFLLWDVYEDFKAYKSN